MKITTSNGILPKFLILVSFVSVFYVLSLFISSFLFELKNSLPVFVSHVEIPRFLSKIGARTMLQTNVGDGGLAYFYINNWKNLHAFYGIQYVKSEKLLEQQKIPKHNFKLDDTRLNQTAMWFRAKFLFDKFGDKAVLISDLPDRVAKEFDDLSLDFIQINYNQDENYCTIMGYLESFWPKLNYGGFVMVNWLVHDETSKKDILKARLQTKSVCSDNVEHENTVEAVTLDFMAKVKVRHYQRLQTDDAIYFRKYFQD